MKLLAIDTSSTACSLALLCDEKILELHEIIPMQQAKRILPMLRSLLEKSRLNLNELDAIAFGAGPGSFTGVRIAASVAQGLAYAKEKPLISISSLAAAAQAAYQELNWEKIIVAVDARMNQVYWATYRAGEDGLVYLLGEEKIDSPQMIAAEGEWYGIGNGWEIYRQDLSFAPKSVDPSMLAKASAILVLAKAKYLRGETLLPTQAVPVYLRDQVAKKFNDS